MCVCARASWRNPTKLNGATCIINLVQFWLFFSFSGSTKTEIGHAIDVQFGECECVCMYRMWSSIQPFSINRNGKNGIWNAKRTDSLSQWHASVVPFRQFHQSNDFFFFSFSTTFAPFAGSAFLLSSRRCQTVKQYFPLCLFDGAFV